MSNKVLIKCFIWLVSEILLTSLGIDDIADYSEFVFERHRLAFGTAQILALSMNLWEENPPATRPASSMTSIPLV